MDLNTTTIKKILMERDGISSKAADELIEEASKALMSYLDEGDFDSAHDICQEYFGLEPDYLFDLL